MGSAGLSGARLRRMRASMAGHVQELASAGALIGMMVGAFPSEEQERPTTLDQYLEALHRRDRSILAWDQFFGAGRPW